MEDTGVDLHQTTGTHVSVQKRATAIRIPVTVPAGKAGESIRIDASFNRLSFPDGGGLGLGTATGWVRTAQTGDWLIRIDPPAGLGPLDLQSVDLTLDLFAPSHAMEVRRGLCAGGTLQSSLPGKLLTTWNASDGLQSLHFRCTAADFDALGRLYLRLTVRAADGAPPATFWQVRDVQVELNAVVRGDAP